MEFEKRAARAVTRGKTRVWKVGIEKGLFCMGTFRSVVLLSVLGVFLSGSAFAQEVVISEFLAIGGDLVDEDGDSPDWVEIQNQSTSTVNLDGWYLTDDDADLMKWRFPDTPLGPGEYLVVFASDKDRAQPGQELHTNFRLGGSGEYLALVLPDGQTVAHAYDPAYPEQQEDISFGLPQAGALLPLVPAGAQALFRVPVDAGGVDWYLPTFDDATWQAGTTGLGFGSDDGGGPLPDGPYNLAPEGQATQSSDYQGQFEAGLAIDGNLGNITHTEPGVNLPATWELDLGDSFSLFSIVLYNRGDCCQSRLRDITVTVLESPGGGVLFESDLMNPENVLGGGGTNGPEVLVLDLVAETGGPISGQVVRVVRTPDPDLSGTGGQGNDDEADVLSLAEVEVLGTEAAYRALIETDVEDAMLDVSPSLHVRIPFVVEADAMFDSLRLRMKYDDGFVAYLNGREVARRNAPTPIAWNSAATTERSESEAVVFEVIDLTGDMDVLETGGNLLAIHGLNFSVDDPDFLLLPELVGSQSVEAAWRYFRHPTPGAPNDDAGLVGLVEDTKFSHDRGFYETPFQVEITTATEGAEIRYTLDGSQPSESNGFTYDGPILIDRTTTLRARAFEEGLEPTNVDTHTYIFVEDVVGQDYQATLAAGFPSSWGGTSPDYGMDPDVIGPNDRFGGVYAATILDDLKSLPTISIVLKTEDMFGPDGIYTHSNQHGVRWERPASVELIQPDGSEGFHVNCGIRIQGGWFRSHSGTRKHSLRLLFKDEYGPTKLRWPLFGKRAAERFDTITLRAGANDGYSWNAARLTEQYTRDQFGRSLQRATGNVGSHGTFVHLYINGIYWGLYNPVERPDHSFSASYFGGDKDDWDSVHDGGATNGDLTAWNDMLRQTSAARGSLAAYQQLQGRNPDGTPNPGYPHLLDVPNYIDYLVVNVWGGNWDWPWKNWWAGRDRTDASTGFKFYCWDFENTMGNNRDRSPLNKNALQNNFSSAGQPHANLRDNPEYRLHFGDRAHRLLFNDGILKSESLIPRYAALVDQVERSIVAESARWGDQHHNPPLTLEEWYDERDWILNTYLPQRSNIVIQQLRSAALYPSIDAPSFQPHGGSVDPGFQLIITAPAGTAYYTLDGTDPRLPGGAVSPTARMTGGGADSVTLLPPSSPARILVPANGSLGTGWTSPDFDDATWIAGSSAVGFDTGSDFDAHLETDLEGSMHDVNSSVYIRVPFDVDPGLFEDGESTLALLTLRVKFDDGYVAYLNGERIATRNGPESPVWDSRATAIHADSQAVVFEALSLPGTTAFLRPGGNLLAIHGLNSSAGGADFLNVPWLTGIPFANAILIEQTTAVQARALDGNTWSALNEATFIVDIPIRITEVMYHPEAPPEPSPLDADDFEFLELQNIGTEALSLDGIRVEGGIQFDFSDGDVNVLQPGELVVIVKDLEAFSSAYDTAGMLLAGEYADRLDNRGDVITLRGPLGEAILDFEYDDEWFPETDGTGPSLVINDATLDPSTWALSTSWHPSDFPFGSPGIDESADPGPQGWQIPGDLNQDGNFDLSDPVALLAHLFLGSWQVLPCGNGSILDPANKALLDVQGDGGVAISDAIFALNYLFLGGPAPSLGGECQQIRGCPDLCR